MTGPSRRGGPAAFFRDNALTLVLIALLLGALAGQAVSGMLNCNSQQLADGAHELSFWDYVSSSSFGVDVAENWQSEYLHFALYIVATVWLLQCGSSESKKPGDLGTQSDEQQKIDHADPVTWFDYATSAEFWNRTLQNWQSEFLAVASMAAFAIYLRQRGSPESKLVGAPHTATAQDSE